MKPLPIIMSADSVRAIMMEIADRAIDSKNVPPANLLIVGILECLAVLVRNPTAGVSRDG